MTTKVFPFEKYIPFDKSWFIRLGVLDLLHGRDRVSHMLTCGRTRNFVMSEWLKRSGLLNMLGGRGVLYDMMTGPEIALSDDLARLYVILLEWGEKK